MKVFEIHSGENQCIKGVDNMNKPNILVVGSMNMDVLIYGADRLPAYGESIMCRSYRSIPGGKGSNQAMAASFQGGRVKMVGRVGDDINGHTLVEGLKQAGVDTRHIILDGNSQTGYDPLIVYDSGKYVSFVVMGANDCLDHRQVSRALAAEKFDMILMQLEMPLETIYKTVEYARAANIPVFLDAGPIREIDLAQLKGIAIISPNEAETKALTGIEADSCENALKAAEYLYAAAQPQYVILKMGEKGAFVYDGQEAYEVPAFSVEAVDSTGAGDTFGATLAVRLCKGEAMKAAVRFANAAAALCVSKKGAQTSIPTEAETIEFVRRYDKRRKEDEG